MSNLQLKRLRVKQVKRGLIYKDKKGNRGCLLLVCVTVVLELTR